MASTEAKDELRELTAQAAAVWLADLPFDRLKADELSVPP